MLLRERQDRMLDQMPCVLAKVIEVYIGDTDTEHPVSEEFECRLHGSASLTRSSLFERAQNESFNTVVRTERTCAGASNSSPATPPGWQPGTRTHRAQSARPVTDVALRRTGIGRSGISMRSKSDVTSDATNG